MSAMERPYRWLTSFVDPAILGAGIAWWVQAVGTYFDGSEETPTGSAIFLGLWFLVYYAVWYYHELVVTKGQCPGDYGKRQLGADILDVFVLPLAFLGLGFATGHYDRHAFALVWMAGAVVPVVALLHNFKTISEHRCTLVPLLLSFIVPLIAVCLICWHEGDPTGDVNPWLLAVFWVILGAYVFFPGWFGSKRG